MERSCITSFLLICSYCIMDLDAHVTGRRENFTAYTRSLQLTSENYPNNYHMNEEVLYVITSFNRKYGIYITFDDFALENSRSCRYDSLKIFRGDAEDDMIINTFCGGNKPNPVFVKNHEITLYFRTDSRRQDRGFKLSYQAKKDNKKKKNEDNAFPGIPIGIGIGVAGTIAVICFCHCKKQKEMQIKAQKAAEEKRKKDEAAKKAKNDKNKQTDHKSTQATGESAAPANPGTQGPDHQKSVSPTGQQTQGNSTVQQTNQNNSPADQQTQSTQPVNPAAQAWSAKPVNQEIQNIQPPSILSPIGSHSQNVPTISQTVQQPMHLIQVQPVTMDSIQTGQPANPSINGSDQPLFAIVTPPSYDALYGTNLSFVSDSKK